MMESSDLEASEHEAFARLVAASARVQDALVTVGPEAAELLACAGALERVAARLAALPQVAGGADPLAISSPDGQFAMRDRALVPSYEIRSEDDHRLVGRAYFRPHFAGMGWVHGGAMALLFDEVLGLLANYPRETLSRTSCLRVDFRAPAPVGRWLPFEVQLDRVEGRKRWVRGTLSADGVVVAEAEGLWIDLPRSP